MEDYEIARDKALKNMVLADHILTMTYPLVQDPKLLKLVMKKVFLSLEESAKALLYYERMYKRVPPFGENFDSMLPHLKGVLERYKISPGYLNFLSEIKEIIAKQEESDIEFVRKEKFVFASKEYDLNYVTTKEIKDYIIKAKMFMNQIMGVVKENERNTGRRS